MPASLAQALVPGLAMMDADPADDLLALERLALWMLQRYAPIAAADPPAGLVLESTGSDHLLGGEPAMLTDMILRLARAGLTASAAIAATWGAAHALARYGGRPTRIILKDETATAIAPLPLEALRLEPHVVSSLRRVGFETIGDLAQQPRAPLALRFGPEPGRRIDQALGRISEPIEPVRPPQTIEVTRRFAEPIGAAATIARYIGQLVPKLCQMLEDKGLGVRCLDLICDRVDTHRQAVRIGTALPARDAKRLIRLLSDKIETIDPGFGIEIMTLVAVKTEPLREKQAVSALIEEPEADVTNLIDMLSNRVGQDRLFRAAPVVSDIPERSVGRIPPLAPETTETWPDHWPRPARLLPAPEPIEAIALLPDHPPSAFTWRGIRRRIKCADGPERVFGEWWKHDAELIAVRDYFRVEDDAGERYWIFRSGDGEDAATGTQRWFLHGIFG
jgi:protein ImuB